MQTQVHRTNPHGHTAADARPEGRVRATVEIRANQMSQMLPDGRAYGPGRHIVQVYQSELPALLALVEPAPEMIDAARKRHERALAKWVGETGQSETSYPGSVEREFRVLVDEDRDLLPLVSVTDIVELEPIADEEERRRVRITTETASAASPVSGGLSLDDVRRLVAEGIVEATGPAIAKAIAAERERVAKAGK